MFFTRVVDKIFRIVRFCFFFFFQHVLTCLSSMTLSTTLSTKETVNVLQINWKVIKQRNVSSRTKVIIGQVLRRKVQVRKTGSKGVRQYSKGEKKPKALQIDIAIEFAHPLFNSKVIYSFVFKIFVAFVF